MNDELLCKICNIKFDFQLAREFHFDIVHNCRAYMCKICENSEDSQPENKNLASWQHSCGHFLLPADSFKTFV